MQILLRLLLLAPLVAVLAGATNRDEGPNFTAEGDLLPPENYREWVFLTSGLDMSYTDAPAAGDHSMFDNVFVDPASWRAFKQTGHWPDKAMFVLEARAANGRGSINRKGKYQTEDRMALEVHVHDTARFKGGWGFFSFDGDAPAHQIPYAAECYSCHLAHGAVDTTFTQFYPTAKPIAVRAGTFRAD